MTNTLFDWAKTTLESQGWPIVVVTEGKTLQSLFNTESLQYNCYLHVYEDQELLVFYSLYPAHVPPERIPKVMELLAYANWSLSWGNFEINPSHGGIRYRTTLRVTLSHLDPGLMKPLTLGNVTTLFRYFPAIEATAEKDCEVTEAMKRVT